MGVKTSLHQIALYEKIKKEEFCVSPDFNAHEVPCALVFSESNGASHFLI